MILLNFFNSNGCELKQEDHGRMFPITNKAADIVNTLFNKMIELGVNVKFSSKVEKN